MSIVRIANSTYGAVSAVTGRTSTSLHIIDSDHLTATGITSRASNGTGITLDGVTNSHIQAVVNNPDSHGVEVVDSVDNVIQVAVDGAGSAGVQLTTSDRNLVTGSVIQPGTATTHAVNVVSGTANMIVGNNLGSAYVTSIIGDTGTDTRWSYPGTAVYGDNFTI